MTTPWAVITGASAGLGVAFAERLASQGSNVLLAARREDRLQEVAERIERTYGTSAAVRAVDLSSPDARAGFVDELRHSEVHTLVNNAGFGSVGQFRELDAARVAQEVSLNVGALTELSHAVVGGMVERGSGAIVNVASTAAFQPISGMAVYAATKGYVLQLSVALWDELHDTGVRALAICPGPTDTEFFSNAGDDNVLRSRRTPEQVVDAAFEGLARHRPFVVDGMRNRVMALGNRFLPRGFQTKVAQLVVKHT